MAIATLEVGDAPVSTYWARLFDSQGFRDATISAIRSFADGRTVPECYDALVDRDVPHWLRSRFIQVARGSRQEAWRLVTNHLPRLAAYTTTGDLFAVARFIADEHPVSETGNPPTVGAVITRALEAADRRKRVDVCQLLATLAQGFDVRVVATRRSQRWLAHEHRDDLPGVSECRGAHREGGPLAEVVNRAVAALDPDGRDVAVLRALVDEASETLSYHGLYGTFPEVSDSWIRQCVNHLVGLELIATFGPQQDRKVELRAAGHRVLKTFDTEIGRRIRLDDPVSETGKSSPQCRVTTRTGGGTDSKALSRTRSAG